MSIQSTVNQTFSLLALATSGSRARQKELKMQHQEEQKAIAAKAKNRELELKELKEDAANLETANEKLAIRISESEEGSADMTPLQEKLAVQKQINAIKEALPMFEKEERIKKRLYEMEPTDENYKSYIEMADYGKLEKSSLAHSTRMLKNMEKDEIAKANREAFRERESQRLRSSILSATEYSPETYNPKINYKEDK